MTRTASIFPTATASYKAKAVYENASKEMPSLADTHLDKALLMEFIKMLTGR